MATFTCFQSCYTLLAVIYVSKSRAPLVQLHWKIKLWSSSEGEDSFLPTCQDIAAPYIHFQSNLPSSSTLPLCFQRFLALPFLIIARLLQPPWANFPLASSLASSEVITFTLLLRQQRRLVHLLSITHFVDCLSSAIVFSPVVICGHFNEAWGGEEINYAFNLPYFHDFFHIIRVKESQWHRMSEIKQL